MAVVVIFSSGGQAKVWPPYVLVTPGEEVVFKCVNTAATVFLPEPTIFAASPRLAGSSAAAGITINLPGTHAVKKIKVKGQTTVVAGRSKYSKVSPKPGVYPYSVYCGGPEDFAVGNSTPVMIIEPPGP